MPLGLLGPAATVLRCAAALALAALGLSACPDPEPAPGPDTTWREAFDTTGVGWLLSVWGPAGADELYAAGGEPGAGALMHYDGATWAPAELGVAVPLLNWIHGFDAQTMVVVGAAGTALHRTAGAWALVDTPTDQDLWGVWGAAPDDLWAVGGNGRQAGQATVLRYQGGAWTPVALPPLQRPNVFAFFKVWGSGPGDVTIVGQRGAVLHWDGQALEEQFVGASVDLIAVWGTGPDRIVAVGGRNNGVISLFDGHSWRTEELAPLRGLNGVWFERPGAVHVVGVQGTLAVIDFDTVQVRETETDVFEDFHAIFGDARGRLTAVGGNFLMANGPYADVAWTRERTSDE
jgi:hypothetical protein